MIIAGVVVFIFIIAIATYGLWGTEIHFGTPTFVASVKNDISDAGKNFAAATNAVDRAEKTLQDQQHTFETDLGANTYFTEEEQNINNVVIDVRKVLVDSNRTIVWFRIGNLTSNTIQIDTQSNLEIVADGITYLPRPLNDAGLATEYETKQGQKEILGTQTIAGQSSLQGYVAFQTVPTPEVFTVRVLNVLNKDTLKKWNYDFVFDTEKLKEEASK